MGKEETQRETERDTGRGLKEGTHLIVGLASPKSTGQAGNSVRIRCCSLEVEFILLHETSLFALKAFN